MAISLIIICLALQRLLLIEYHVYQLPDWLMFYFRWLIKTVDRITQVHALAGILILILPLVVIGSLFYAGVYHLLGAFFYYILNFVLLWLCIDGSPLSQRNNILSAEELFIISYQRFFAGLFWFLILGPAGLILYTATSSLRKFLNTAKEVDLLNHAVKLQGYLDWIPLRLVGLSYALMGNFAMALKAWLSHLWQAPAADQQPIVYFGLAALAYTNSEPEVSLKTVINLIDRVILFWLIVIVLFTLEFWLG